MSIVQKLSLALSIFVILAVPAQAGVTVNNPANNSDVTSPFTLSATATTCSSESVTSMGYSFDSSTDTTIIDDTSIDTLVGSAAGTHTLHVKAWSNGATCVTDVIITVKAGATSANGDSNVPTDTSAVPTDAVTVSNIELMGDWKEAHDTGGSGSSSGSTAIVSSPSLHGNSRRFVTQFKDAGDERYSLTWSDGTEPLNFFYDAWVYLTSSASHIGNLEMDVNQTMPNGKTALFGVQCDGYSGHWAYTENRGTDSKPSPHWVSVSGTTCNPQNWSRDKWHHVQASYSRTDSGTITYHSVWLDGAEGKLNATVNGAFDLGWGPTINTQFQVDGYGSSGTVTVYLTSLSISRW
jgi:hypothetical protein